MLLQVLLAVLVEIICLQTLVRRSVERERCRRRFLVCPVVIPIVVEPASGIHLLSISLVRSHCALPLVLHMLQRLTLQTYSAIESLTFSRDLI